MNYIFWWDIHTRDVSLQCIVARVGKFKPNSKSVCDHQGIARMHLALLLSYAIILCNLGSVATGPRSKKRGKSDIHQEGAGLFDPRSVHDHINIHF